MGVHKQKNGLVLFGVGGHSLSTFDSVTGYNVVGFIDEWIEGFFLGLPIYRSIRDVPNYESFYYHIAVGDCELRKKFYDQCKIENVKLVNIIHPTACVSEYSQIGEGNYIGRFATIGVDVIIGDNNLFNTGCIVEHGCRIGSHNNVSTNAVLNGDEIIHDECFIGSNSVLKGQLEVHSRSIIGCGAVCIHDVPEGITVAGNPAKEIRGK